MPRKVIEALLLLKQYNLPIYEPDTRDLGDNTWRIVIDAGYISAEVVTKLYTLIGNFQVHQLNSVDSFKMCFYIDMNN